MSSLAVPSGRKKPRTKESKPPITSVKSSDRIPTSLPHPSSSTVAVDDASAAAPTDLPYVCTGRFAVDFVQLCRRAHLSYVPNVVARPHRPTTAPPAPSVVDDKKSTITRPAAAKMAPSIQFAPHHSVADQLLAPDAVEMIIPEPPPKTYAIRDAVSFFRPSVQVEADKLPVEQAAVTEVYIHGWKVDDVMLGILEECFPAVTSLHTVDLWNVGLNDVTLASLVSVLPRCRALRSLILDGNCVKSQHWHLLIQNDSPILHLSARYCGITSLGAKYLSDSLGSATHQNTRLLSLDLAGNHVSDAGALYLAGALRLNRTLLVLNLAGNGISDVGASQLAVVLSKFELTHDEVAQRRRLLYARRLHAPSRHLSGGKLKVTRSSTSVGSHQSHRGRKMTQSGHRRRSTDRADHGKTLKSSGKTAGKSGKQLQVDDGRGRKEKRSSKSRKSASIVRGLDISESAHSLDSQASDSTQHPLLSAVVLRESTVEFPTTLVRGNRTLISLNLSRNEIGHVGMTALLDAALPLSRDPVPSDPMMPGLLRLTTHNNHAPRIADGSQTVRPVDDVDALARYVAAAMATRDPMLRHPRAPVVNKPVRSSTQINVIEA